MVLIVGLGVLLPDPSMRYFLFQLGIYNTLLVMAVFIYIYSTIKPLIMDQRIVLAKRLWIVVGCLWIINPIILIGAWFSPWPPVIFQFWDLFRLKLFFNLILMVYITVRYPEAVLISHAQLNRALNVYSSVISLHTEKEVQDFGMSSLVAYIKQIPRELIDKSADI
ncbi:MAG: hypothetical protein JSW11_02870 [Candidatus Heimdallarchaeota archaeon]|nr:MAG: hypothetical protein JSW11_02870 [Candidatus Heimdallarchaeota archaeon]